MFRTIVWAADGSPSSLSALEVAKYLAKEQRAKLVVVHVVELIGGRAGVVPRHVGEDTIARDLAGRVSELRSEGLEVEQVTARSLLVGVAETIAAAASKQDADLVVVGTRGRSRLANRFLGSVTQRLVRVAPCPVLAVTPGVEPREAVLVDESRIAA